MSTVDDRIAAPFPGLSDDEAARRRAAGQGNDVEIRTGRTYGRIVRDNVFNFINNLFYFLGALLLILGKPLDGFSVVFVIAANTIISLVQEVRAKRVMDRIAILHAAQGGCGARRVRGGARPVAGRTRRHPAPAARRPGRRRRPHGRRGPHGGRRVAAHRRVRPRDQARRRHAHVGQLLHDRRRLLRSREGRRRELRQQAHRQGHHLQARAHAAAEAGQPDRARAAHRRDRVRGPRVDRATSSPRCPSCRACGCPL